MSYKLDSIVEAITEARAKGTEKGIKFEQSFDLSINFRKRELDVTKPENRLNQEVLLPNTLYPPAKVCAFGDGEFAEKARAAGAETVVSKDDIPKLGEEKKERKALAKRHDFFIASLDSMPLVGRYLGQALGPRGKMPKPFPPQADLSAVVSQYHRTVKVRMRNTPTFHVKVGHIRMGDREIADNVQSILSFVEGKGHLDKIGSLVVKTTMGPSVVVKR
ncbi:MAG: 50S ribosomal protein L1 [Candidatus Thorarchaeota archaeon]|jgi:large subunit ribosomal protein L1